MDDLDRDDIVRILATAGRFTEVMGRDNKKVPTLRGRTVINLFFEASTRTATSFELAAKRLSADVVSIKASGSSVEKGESLKDTILTLNAYGPDIFVIRHGGVGACNLASRFTDAAVLNAGDGKHQHPSQALLDLYTIEREVGPVDGLHVAIVGDVVHSRGAERITGLTTMGAKVTLVGPPTRSGRPSRSASPPARTSGTSGRRRRHVLRMQHERMGDGGFVPSPASAPPTQGHPRPPASRPARHARQADQPRVEIPASSRTTRPRSSSGRPANGLVVHMAIFYDLLTNRRPFQPFLPEPAVAAGHSFDPA